MNTRRRMGCIVLVFAGLGLMGALAAVCVLVMSVGSMSLGGASGMVDYPTRIPASSAMTSEATRPPAEGFATPTPAPLATATAGPGQATTFFVWPPSLLTPLPTATIAPQATPKNGAVPTSVAGDDGAATGTAVAFDVQATNDQAADASAPVQPPQVAMVTREFAIYDEAGAELGSGQVRVYAPARIGLDSAAEIRIEILTNAVVAEGTSTMSPPFTATPSLTTPKPTHTPLPLVDSQFVIVREYMGAGLRGPDMGNFKVDPVPPSGLRRIQAGAVNWWKWSIRPVGEQAIGTNNLEIYIYLPRTRSDGTAFNEETNTVPLQIQVASGQTSRPSGVPGGLLAVAGALIAIGGAGGAFYGTFSFARQSRQSKQPAPPPVTVEGRPGAEDDIDIKVSGDVDGQVTIAGDDVITYQTVVQRMPVSLVIGLIVGLAALVLGLAVIAVVLIGGL